MKTNNNFGLDKILLLLLIGCMSLIFSSCSKERFEANTSLAEFQRHASLPDYSSKQVVASKQNLFSGTINRQVVTSAGLSLREERGDYLLGAGDVLEIAVLESEELSTEARVSSRGNINVPLLGVVNVLHKSVAEVEKDIERRYSKTYIYDPHVSVQIKEHISKQITVVGAVEKPGTYEYIAQKRLLDVLALAGGLKEDAGAFAFLTRRDLKTGKAADYRIDMDELVKKGNMSHNYVVHGGDVLFVPESGKCFVDGAVRKPGTYPIRNNMTVTEVIAQAGGLAGYANDDSIKLIRFIERGQKREIVSLSYGDLQGGAGDSILIKDQDMIYAESSTAGKIFSGSGLTLGFLGTGVSFKNPEQ